MERIEELVHSLTPSNELIDKHSFSSSFDLLPNEQHDQKEQDCDFRRTHLLKRFQTVSSEALEEAKKIFERDDFLVNLRKKTSDDYDDEGEEGLEMIMNDRRSSPITTTMEIKKKKVLIEVIGESENSPSTINDDNKDENDAKMNGRRRRKHKQKILNDFVIALCGFIKNSDGLAKWSNEELSNLSSEILRAYFVGGEQKLTSDELDCERVWSDLKPHKSAPEKESWNSELAERRDSRAFFASMQALSVLEHVSFGEYSFDRFISIALRALEFESVATKRVGARITNRLLVDLLEIGTKTKTTTTDKLNSLLIRSGVKHIQKQCALDTRGISKALFEQLMENMVGATAALFEPTLQALMTCANVRKFESKKMKGQEDADWQFHDLVLGQSLDSVALHVDDYSFVAPLLRAIPEFCSDLKIRMVGRFKFLIPAVLAWTKAPSNDVALLALEALHEILQFTWPRAYSRCKEIWESMKTTYQEGPRIIEEEEFEKRRRAIEKVLIVLNAACGPVFTKIVSAERETYDSRLKEFVERLKKYKGDGNGNPYVGFQDFKPIEIEQ
mgnify:CR=1 FL=1|jgi:hypothetical protein